MIVVAKDYFNNTYHVGDKLEYISKTFGKIEVEVTAIAHTVKPRMTVKYMEQKMDGEREHVFAIYNLYNVIKLP